MYKMRFKKPGLVALVGACGVALLVVVTPMIRRSVSGPPFRLVIEPAGDQAHVTFLRPGTGLKSRDFAVNMNISKRCEVVLESAAVQIPGGRIEFADTTVLPGRFRLRLGDSRFDVMQVGIDVDGRMSDWVREEHGAGLPLAISPPTSPAAPD